MAAFLRGIGRILAHRRLPAALALLSVLLLLPALGAGFQLDDHFQRARLLGFGEPSIRLFEFYDGDPVANRARMDEGRLPWWTAPDLRHKSLRYVSVVTMQLDYVLWPDSPALMHLHSLLWLAAMVLAAAWLYRSVMSPAWVAGLAALLFAVEDAHVAASGYLANRNALIATFFGLTCLLTHIRWRRDGWRAGAVWSPVLLALSLGAAEIGLGAVAYLGSWVVFVDRDPWRQRLASVAPVGAVVILWLAVYSAFGFGSSGSDFYMHPLADPMAFLGALWRNVPVLLVGQWTLIPADLALVSNPGRNDAAGLQTLGLVLIGVLALCLAPLLRRDAVARFWCAGALLSLVPISATGPQNRLLFFVGVGSMALLASFVHDLATHGKSRPVWLRGPAWIVAGLLLGTHLLIAPLSSPLILAYQDRVQQGLDRAFASVPDDPALADQDLILVNPPDHTYTVGAIPAVRRVNGGPVPRRMRALSVGSSPIRVTRIDEHTLELHIAYGLFSTPISRYFRERSQGFAAGEIYEIADLEIEVVDLTEDGDPRTLRYRFRVPLEDPSLRWLRWQDRRYEPFAPPPVGESIDLAPSRGVFDPDGPAEGAADR